MQLFVTSFGENRNLYSSKHPEIVLLSRIPDKIFEPENVSLGYAGRYKNNCPFLPHQMRNYDFPLALQRAVSLAWEQVWL